MLHIMLCVAAVLKGVQNLVGMVVWLCWSAVDQMDGMEEQLQVVILR